MRPEAVSLPPSRGICRYLMLSVFLMLGVGAVHAQTLVAGLQPSPSAVDFGTQNLNSQTAKQVTLRNSGPSAVTISGITVTGAGFGFSNLTPGTSLGPGQQTVLQVSFKPTSSGTYSGQVTILNSGATSAVSVPLVGTGVSASAAAKTAQMAATSAATTTTATTTTAAQAKLSWNASTSPVTGYKVYRGPVSGGPYSTLTSTSISTLTYTDTNVVAGTTYYYVVTSVNSSGVESVYSNEAVAAVPGGSTSPPPPPSSVPTSPVTGMILNGSAKLNGTKLRLTTTSQNLAGSGWFSTPVNIQNFSTDFTFQITNTSGSGTGNGMTFVIQNKGTTAVGPSGGGLGYGPDQPKNATGSANSPITKSVAVKFDLVNNAGEGTNSTGMYLNGASPTIPAVTLGGGVNLHTSDVFQANLSYDGKTLTMTITDTAHTSQKFTTSWAVNIPGTVGANTAYVGFTGGTGSSVANLDIATWNFSSSTISTTPTKTPVVYRTATLPAASSGPTFRTFTYAGFPDTTGTILDATAVGNSVTFTVNVATAGTYDINLSYKKANSRGISQLTINGTKVGATLDQYLASEAYATVDYGNFTFGQAGNYSFKFAITGKNSNSTSYSEAFDDITLTPQ